MDPLSFVVAGGVAVVAIAMSPNRSHSDVKKCVEAYYSDKYNGFPAGRPAATFMTCMEKTFPRTFAEAEKRYKPQNVTAVATAPPTEAR